MTDGRSWWVLGLGVIVACGGSTSSDGAGGSSSGGSGNTGALGGSSSGGSGNTGNVAGTGATGGFVAVSGTGGTGGTSWTACDAPGTCSLVPVNCCGYCQPGEPLSGWQVVNVDYEKDLYQSLCADPVACPDCITHQDPNYLALCRGGQCTAVDLRLDDLSACNSASDCKLRRGSGCCESCNDNNDEIVSYNKNANLEAEVCGPFGGACPPCVGPEIPDWIVPTCNGFGALGNCGHTIVGP